MRWSSWCHCHFHHLLSHFNPEWFTFLILAYSDCPGKEATHTHTHTHAHAHTHTHTHTHTGSTVTANVMTRSSVLPQRCVEPLTCCTMSNDDSTSLRRRLSGSAASWNRTLKSPSVTTGHALMTNVSKTAVNSSKNCADGFSEPGR